MPARCLHDQKLWVALCPHIVQRRTNTAPAVRESVSDRERLIGVQILLSNSQVGPGRTVKQEQEEISRNHVPSL